MQVARLKAEFRTAIGRNQTKHLRSKGWLPAVVYGMDKDPQPISISEWEFEQAIKHHHKVYSLEIDGAQQDTFLQDLQFDPLTDRPQHVDFKRIDLNKPVELEVEIMLLGHPVGLGKGGVLLKDLTDLRIRCLPTAIPESISVAIGGLEVDDILTAAQIPLPEGVELVTDAEASICRVVAAGKVGGAGALAEEAAAEGEATGEAAAEGEAPAGEGEPKTEE